MSTCSAMGRRAMARKPPSFMKILVGDFSTKLLIPPKFVRLHRDTLPRKCVLRPSHTQDSWPVRIKQINNFLYFSRGWGKFARYHSLKSHDHLLVFRYAQDSEFYVDMFDKSCCSKELALTSRNVKYSRRAILPRRKRTVNHESTPALIAAQELMASSEFPTFHLVMQPIYVKSGGYMHIPKDFSTMYLKDSTKEVKIEVCGETWRFGAARDRFTRRLTRGWCPFVKEKGLQRGDVCVFQLTNTQDFTLKLSIFKKNGKACF